MALSQGPVLAKRAEKSPEATGRECRVVACFRQASLRSFTLQPILAAPLSVAASALEAHSLPGGSSSGAAGGSAAEATAAAAAVLEEMVLQARPIQLGNEEQPIASTSRTRIDVQSRSRLRVTPSQQQDVEQRQQEQFGFASYVPPLQQQKQQERPPWQATVAPRTREAAHAPDPRLASLSQQLLAAKSPVDMRALLAAAQLSTDEIRRLLTYLDRAGAAGVALAAMRAAGEAWQRSPDAPLIWTKLIRMLGRRPADTGAALGVYRQMLAEGVDPDVVAFNTALSVAARGRHWRAANGILRDMRAAGVAPDAYTYSALLDVAAACRRADQALAWFDEMRAARVAPNAVHFTTLMAALQARTGRRRAESQAGGLPVLVPGFAFFRSLQSVWPSACRALP